MSKACSSGSRSSSSSSSSISNDTELPNLMILSTPSILLYTHTTRNLHHHCHITQVDPRRCERRGQGGETGVPPCERRLDRCQCRIREREREISLVVFPTAKLCGGFLKCTTVSTLKHQCGEAVVVTGKSLQ